MLNSIRDIHGSPMPRKLVLSEGASLFKTGEIFRGTVLKRFSPGEMLIRARGKEFRARTDLRLEPGARYGFQAIRSGQKCELRVIEALPRDPRIPYEPGQAFRKDGHLIGELLMELSRFRMKGMPAGISKELENINLLVSGLTYNGGKGLQENWFSRFLQVSGLFWESKLARIFSNARRVSRRNPLLQDLKGGLLALKLNLARAAEGAWGTDNPEKKIDQVLRFIEQEQWLNLSLSRAGLGWYWFIPGAGEEEFRGAEIFVNQEDEGEVTRFCLMAEFSKLGPILAEFFLGKTSIDLSFLVEDKQAEQFISGYTGELREGLKKAGFSPGTITCRIGEEIDSHMARLLEENVSEGAFHLVI